MIGIIDYHMGNLRSVQKALEHQRANAMILQNPNEAASCEKLILPGVGAFADGMKYLRELGWIDVINQHLAQNKPLLGICLGMQLLMDSSMEDAESADEPVAGLGIVPGRVWRFHEDQGEGQPRLKVPHMGWNTLAFSDNAQPLFTGLKSGCHCYFVHGFYCEPADASIAIATTDYGSLFCSALRDGPVLATQFHPEKSQTVGLQMLANFAAM